jgi:hypothetical protein
MYKFFIVTMMALLPIFSTADTITLDDSLGAGAIRSRLNGGVPIGGISCVREKGSRATFCTIESQLDGRAIWESLRVRGLQISSGDNHFIWQKKVGPLVCERSYFMRPYGSNSWSCYIEIPVSPKATSSDNSGETSSTVQ